MYKVIALTVLLAFASAMTKDTKTILTEIDADNFGNSILSTVQMYLSAKGSADEVIMLLNQIMAGINDD